MRRLITSRPHLSPPLAILFSVGPWVMLWLSISSGDPAAILNPQSPIAFAQGGRALFPLAAAGAAAIFIGIKTFQKVPRTFGFFGPLGLTSAYGLAGLVASLRSPDGSAALWWAILYLSVPIALWGAAWEAAPLARLHRLVDATWLVVILATSVLFVVAALQLDLVDKILNPTQLLQCQAPHWSELTGGRLRSTGVGRYAAIGGIIALGGLWQGRRRPIWLAVLLTSVTLLLHSSARGSFVGFAFAAILILSIYLYHSSKRVLLAALLVILVALPLVWSTGAPLVLLKECALRTSAAPPLFAVAPSGTGSTTPDKSSNVPDEIPTQILGGVESDKQQLTQPVASKKGSRSQVPPKGARPQVQAPLERPTSEAPTDIGPLGLLVRKLGAKEIFKLSGRTAVWAEGLGLIKDSPVIGFGFHADRLLLGTQMHNSVLHATLQAGLLGAIPFVAAMLFAWVLFIRMVRRLNLLSGVHKRLVIQSGGVLAFLTFRSLTESTGAFFGVDWLILAPIMFYLQLVNDGLHRASSAGDHRMLE